MLFLWLKFQPVEQGIGQNGDFLIGPTCYFCWSLETHLRTHTNTHNLRNVSRRFECQGFPSCWPAVGAAAGCGCVAVCKGYPEENMADPFTAEEQTICLYRACAQTKHMLWYMWHIKELSLESGYKNWVTQGRFIIYYLDESWSSILVLRIQTFFLLFINQYFFFSTF